MAQFSGFDIFGVPLEYLSMDARRANWPAYIQKLSSILNVAINRTFKVSIYDIYQCVFLGFLSFKSASYFLLGRFNLLQDDYLSTFVSFIHDNPTMCNSKIQLLWQGKNPVVPENTFLFPLVELDSSQAMTLLLKERNEYARRKWINEQFDLPLAFPDEV